MQATCPYCSNPTALAHDADLSSIECSSCGSRFSLLVEETASLSHPKQRTLGHFELTEQVGAGAFGTVWRATDTRLDRTVAIKIPRVNRSEEQGFDQFLREARSVAQLNHPNIVAIHEVGLEDGQTYIVSNFVEGVPLSSWLTAKRPTFSESAELCLKLARALEHAHQSGVVHRDVKPSNIMLDPAGEPHLMDFGLAKRDAAEVTVTLEGKVLGTPAYMSPEQARGDAHVADARSDIYSLGVVLFELLTDQRPFQGDLRMLMHQVLFEEPSSPRQRRPDVPPDLDAICMKCLEKKPEARYATARALASDLNNYLNGEPIVARPHGLVRRASRWYRKHKGLVFGVLTFVTAAVLVGVIAIQTREGAPPTNDPEALQAYERGLDVLQRRTKDQLQLAVRDFDAAIARDPKFALAYAGRAEALSLFPYYEVGRPREAMEQAIADAEAALRLDGSLVAAHTVLGHVKAVYGWDWEGSARQLERAIDLEPENAQARFRLALTWMMTGRLDDSLKEIQQAQRLDATSKIIALNMGHVHVVRDEADAAIRVLSDLQRRHPTYPHTYFVLGNAYVGNRDFASASESHRRAVEQTDGAPLNRAALVFSLAATGDPASQSEARAILADLQANPESKYVSNTALAIAHIGLGDLDAAFEALNLAATHRDVGLPYHIRTYLFAGIRKDARYRALMRRMGLPP